MNQQAQPDWKHSLQEFLDSDRAGEEALDYISSQGFLTALAISPVQLPEAAWQEELFGGEPNYQSPEEKQQVLTGLNLLKKEIDRAFNSEEGFDLPCEPAMENELEDSELQDWCVGFMVGQMLQEDAWFNHEEQFVGELLLPIMVASGLFAESPEFREITKDSALISDMCLQIPEVLTELYLHFQASEEKGKK